MQKIILLLFLLASVVLISSCEEKKEEKLYIYTETILKETFSLGYVPDTTVYKFKFYEYDDREAYLEAFRMFRTNTRYLYDVTGKSFRDTEFYYFVYKFELTDADHNIIDPGSDEKLEYELMGIQTRINEGRTPPF